MAHTSAQTADPFRGGISSPVRLRSPFATRRRVLASACLLVVLGFAVLTNYGPLHAYRDAHARMQAARAQVSALEEQKTNLQAQLGKLSEAGYLESLARKELTFARPGEQVFILTGGAEGAAATSQGGSGKAPDGGSSAATHPGFLERVLTAIAGLF
jgi:cell division protein FtsB